MKLFKKSILVTGGAGFIGSHLVRRMVSRYPDYRIVNYDALSYAGNLSSLEDIKGASNYEFVRGDIRNSEHLQKVFKDYEVSDVLHLAAESHVDRSILNPMVFVETNVIGTVTLLNTAKAYWGKDSSHRFYHISTDEVFGSLGDEGAFTENTSYDPRSPYSASKAASDHFVRAYFHTYDLPIVMSNCSNNYGPYQFPEKLIPLMIHNIQYGKELPVYGAGINVRDWIYVEDHVEAIDLIFHNGKIGETYAVGGDNEQKNIDVVHGLIDSVDSVMGRPIGQSRSLIKFVKARAGHDLRDAIDGSKIKDVLGWTPKTNWQAGLQKTVNWYIDNTSWVEQVVNGDYKNYYSKQYLNR